MFYQIFVSPQVKRCEIITYKHGIYEFLHAFLNDVKHFGRWGGGLVPTQEKKTYGIFVAGRAFAPHKKKN